MTASPPALEPTEPLVAPEVPQLEYLIERVHQAWHEGVRPEQQEAALAAEGRSLAVSFLLVGDRFHALLLAADDPAQPKTTLTDEGRAYALVQTFEWPEGAKKFLVLWRNVLVEWERAAVLLREHSIKPERLARLATAARDQLEGALRHWYAEIDAHHTALATPNTARARLHTYSLQNNPWPTYQKQIKEVDKQISQLHTDFEVRLQAASTMSRLAGMLGEVPARIDEAFDQLRDAAYVAIGVVDDAEGSQPGKVSSTRLEAIDPGDKYLELAESLAREVHNFVERLPHDTQLFVADAEGRLQYRNLNLERQTGQWLSAEVLPGLQSGAQGVEQASADFSRTLVDVRNRVLLARERSTNDVAEADDTEEVATEEYVANLEALRTPLETFIERLNRIRGDAARDTRLAADKTLEEMRLSRVYDPSVGFLEVSFGAGMSQVRRTQDALFTKFGDWLVEQRDVFRRIRARVTDEEQLSTGERIVRVLRARRTDPSNAAYTSVLITRGFIGEAFHAGREREIERTVDAIEAWREGFRGSIVVTGQRYSGKTHFTELIAGRHFEQKVVRLRPQSNIELAGRTQQTSHDLGAALAFVRKHSVGTRMLVLVDDLELWQGPGHELTNNARALRDAVDELSGRLAFLVTMGNWTLARLESGLELGAAFQLEINLDTMPLGDFTQTVLTRHAATHLTLVDAEGDSLGESALRDLAETVWRTSRGNVGDGLRRWAQSVTRVDVDHVRVEERPNYLLPNFIDADTGVVLAAVKHARFTSEYSLRKRLGPAFEVHYRPIIKRLLRLEILQRRRSGALSLNPVLTNEVGRLLEREDFIVADYAQAPLHL